jgi:anti-sigma-K factor RskA
MRYDRPELRERLAADYVLGTMRGRARRRFESLLRADPALAEEVARWESRLGPLAQAIPPLEPPPRLWQAVERRIAGAAPLETSAQAPGFWSNLAFWRGFGLAAGALAALLAVYVALRPPVPAEAPQAVAMLNDEAGRAAFLVELESGRKLALRALAVGDPGTGHSYELWLLPKAGNPRPLGLMPVAGAARLEVSAADAALLPGSQALAVSLEPAGGSPTGLPTGPVLFKGALVAAR